MKKVILALCILVTFFSASAKENSPSFIYSVYRNFSSYPINKAAGDATRKTVSKIFPGWNVYTDKLNGTITTAYGPGIVLPGNSPSDKAEYCMEHMLNTLGINKSDWKQISNVTADDRIYLYYGQVYNGHKVFMSRSSFQFSGGGQLLKIQMKNYGAADNKLIPIIAAKDALNTAISDLPGIIISDKQVANDWDWFPIPSASGYTLHPSWHFSLTGKQLGTPVKLTGYVDGITGELLYRMNEVKDNYNVKIKGTVYKNGTLNPTTLEALPDITLTIGVNHYTTDTAGFYSNAGLALPVSTTVPLAGLWSTVTDATTISTPTFTDLVSTLGTAYTYPATAPSSSRDVNAYYHVNRVHNFMKTYLPTFTGMDFSLPTNVDMPGYCNAYYDGMSINFYAAGGGCNSFAELGDVVYHEYGHGITDHMYTNITGQTIQNPALNEATSDTWAFSITHNPILAANAYTGFQGFGRRYDMTPQIYPQDIPLSIEPHQTGQIIAGTWWDVGANIGSIDTMTRLMTKVYYDVPDGIWGTEGQVYQTVLVDALLADDNDNNLNNGTPHYRQIIAAFAKHGIYLEQDVILSHQEIADMPAGVAIPVTATLYVEDPTHFQRLLVYYRSHTATSFDSIIMTTTDNTTYTANIPAQHKGVLIDYYFAIQDGLHVINAYFPIGYDPAIPSYQSTIPYQFGVGMFSVDSTQFETNPTGWNIGNNTGDNATTGTWQRTIPVPNIDTNAWPATDNSGSGKCLLTGNGTIPTHVGNGATSVLSPVFNISHFNKPIVEYHRWFSNDLGENFKNDPWQVMIKDASTSNWKVVEKTYQSDYNWRRRIFAVSEYLPAGTANIQVRFVASDSILSNWLDRGQSVTVGGVDDFYLYDAGNSTGVDNVTAAKAKIYPNPADKQLEIMFPDMSLTYTITIYDMSGKSVYSTLSKGQSSYPIDVSQMAAGVYTLMIQTESAVQSQKIVVTHN